MTVTAKIVFPTGSVLGTGWGFPFGFTGSSTDSNRGIARVSDEAAIKASLEQIIGTLFGSRFFRRRLGSRLRDLVLMPNDESLDSLAAHYISEAVGDWEKRIILGPIAFDRTERDLGRILISTEFRAIKTQRAGNYVFPYYLAGFEAA